MAADERPALQAASGCTKGVERKPLQL